jgi:chemotaxis signal transduction protein
VSGVQVRVRVGGEQYALPVAHIHEVVDLGKLGAVPGSADCVLGLLNLNGEIVPAFDLASILQIARDAQPRRLLITQRGSQRAAFAVDEVLDVGPLDGTMQESDSPHLLASMVLDGAMVGMLDVDGLFASIAPGDREDDQ